MDVESFFSWLFYLVLCGTFLYAFGTGIGMVFSRKLFEKYKKIIKTAAEEAVQSHPWLSLQIADIMELFDKEAEMVLRTKKHPAIKAADQVSKISKEKKELQSKCKAMEYQIHFGNLYFHGFRILKKFQYKKHGCIKIQNMKKIMISQKTGFLLLNIKS